MKLFQKSALAVAIAAVPFLSVNAMEALDDATLSEMTGQAGVTIETTVDGAKGITIGSIKYTDTLTDPAATGEIGGGSLLITGTEIGTTGEYTSGVAVYGMVDDGAGNWIRGKSTTSQTIDIDTNGNLITNTTAIGAGMRANVAVNGVTNLDVNGDPTTGLLVNTTAQEITVGQVLLQGSSQTGRDGAQLVSNLAMTIESGDSRAHILNLTSGQSFGTAGEEKYTIADHSNGIVDISGAIDSGSDLAIVTESASRISGLSVDALDGAIGIRDMSYGGGANGDELMHSTQVIWAIGGPAVAGDSTSGGVYIQGSDSVGTLTIGELHIADANIGRIQISDISQGGSVTRIYGH